MAACQIKFVFNVAFCTLPFHIELFSVEWTRFHVLVQLTCFSHSAYIAFSKS